MLLHGLPLGVVGVPRSGRMPDDQQIVCVQDRGGMKDTKRWPLTRRSKAVAIDPRHHTQFGSPQSSTSGVIR